MVKAGVSIPASASYLVYNREDGFSATEYSFIDGLLHKLAQYYIDLTKEDFLNNNKECSGDEFEKAVNKAFSPNNSSPYESFLEAKNFCPEGNYLQKITNEFDAYYEVLGKALNKFDNHFALQVLTVNGMFPPALNQELRVFRGMVANIDENDVDALFKFSYRAYSVGMYQKHLGYYVNQPWNKAEGARWEFGGTYVTLEPNMGSGFASGITTKLDAESILLEMRLAKGSPEICGPWKVEYELMPSTIEGSDIIAIYFIDKNSKGEHVVYKQFKNPYIEGSAEPSYKERDVIVKNEEAVANYNSLSCSELSTNDKKHEFTVYSDYEDFLEKYTEKQHHFNEELLLEYFNLNGYLYEEDSWSDECNPETMCC